MLEFEVTGMSCGHCVGRVEAAVHQVDPAASVNVDLAGGHVSVESRHPRDPFLAALAAAGYPAQ